MYTRLLAVVGAMDLSIILEAAAATHSTRACMYVYAVLSRLGNLISNLIAPLFLSMRA